MHVGEPHQIVLTKGNYDYDPLGVRNGALLLSPMKHLLLDWHSFNTHEICRYLIKKRFFRCPKKGLQRQQCCIVPRCPKGRRPVENLWPSGLEIGRSACLESTVFNKEIWDFDNFGFLVSIFIFHLSCVDMIRLLKTSNIIATVQSQKSWPRQGAVLIFVVEVRRVSFKGCSASIWEAINLGPILQL